MYNPETAVGFYKDSTKQLRTCAKESAYRRAKDKIAAIEHCWIDFESLEELNKALLEFHTEWRKKNK